MKKIWDKLKSRIYTNKKMLIFFVSLILIGIICGSLFSVTINSSDKSLVKEYLDNFFGNIENNNISYYNTFINSLVSNFSFIVIVWLLGFSIIGLPVTLFMYFSKAFSLGFSIASLIMNYKLKGLLYAVIYVLPSQICFFLAFSILMLYSVSLSLKLFGAIVKKVQVDFRVIINKYLIILLICTTINITGVLFESYIMPIVMKLALLI